MKREALQRNDVSSSAIVSVGYDDAVRVLEIEFRSGGIYQYLGVPAEVYAGLLTAMSVGRYFLDNIKHNYDYERVM